MSPGYKAGVLSIGRGERLCRLTLQRYNTLIPFENLCNSCRKSGNDFSKNSATVKQGPFVSRLGIWRFCIARSNPVLRQPSTTATVLGISVYAAHPVLKNLLLREKDSNLRPPGYGPGELTTAPPRNLFDDAKIAWKFSRMNSLQDLQKTGKSISPSYLCISIKATGLSSIWFGKALSAKEGGPEVRKDSD